MAINVDIGGVSFSVPETGERSWGQDTTDLLVSLANASYLIRGGNIPLVSEADFGPTAGLKAVWFASRSGSEADSGVVRLSNLDAVSWRNAANDGNIDLSVDASDKLIFDGSEVLDEDNTATVSNKTIDNTNTITVQDANLTVQDDVDNTKQLQLDVSAVTTGTTRTLSAPDADGTIALTSDIPNVPVDSVFGRTGAVVAESDDYTWAQVDKTVSDLADLTTKSHTSLSDIGTNTHDQIDTHISDVANPHAVTATQVGLGNVDDTSDADKPISDATQIALDLKIEESDNPQFTSTESVKLPAGTTAERPVSPADGQIRFNSDLDAFEGYKASEWSAIGGGGGLLLEPISAAQTMEIGKMYLTDSDAGTFTLTLPDPAGFSASDIEQAVIVVQDSALVAGDDGKSVVVAPHSGGVIATNRGLQAVDETLEQDKTGWAVQYSWDNDASHWKAQDYLGAQGTGTTEIRVPKVTAWQNYTPTADTAIGTLAFSQWRQVGESLELRIRVSTPDNAFINSRSLSIPAGLTISDDLAHVGTGSENTATTFNIYCRSAQNDVLLRMSPSIPTSVALQVLVKVDEFAGDNAFDIIDVAQLSGESAGGDFNYVENPFASVDTSGHSVNVSSGSFTVDRTTTSAELPSTNAAAWKISGSGVTIGDSIQFATKRNIANSVKNVGTYQLKIVDINGSLSSDWEAQLYNVTDAVLVGSVAELQSTNTYDLDAIIQPDKEFAIRMIAKVASPAAVSLEAGLFEESMSIGSAGGWKVYDESDVTITNSSTGGVVEAWLRPTKDPVSGNWYLNGRIDFNTWTTPAVSGTITIAGIDVVGTQRRGVTSSTNSGTIASNSYFSGDTITWGTSAIVNRLSVQINNLPLASKPTWVDWDNTLPTISDVKYENARGKFSRVASGSYSVNTIFPFDTESTYMKANGVNNSAGTLSVSAAGTYRITSGIRASSALAATTFMTLFKNGSAGPFMAGTNEEFISGSTTIDLTPDDVFSIRVSNSFTINPGDTECWVDIVRVSDYSGRAAGLPLANGTLRLDSGNGHGSTNNKIRRFSNITEQSGDAFTYTDSETDGMSITANRDMVVSISYTDRNSSAAWQAGISLNSSQLTTGIFSITAADRLILNAEGNDTYGNCSVTIKVNKGDILRAHTDGTPNSTFSTVQFIIQEITRLV